MDNKIPEDPQLEEIFNRVLFVCLYVGYQNQCPVQFVSLK